jgi:hypothetical protein
MASAEKAGRVEGDVNRIVIIMALLVMLAWTTELPYEHAEKILRFERSWGVYVRDYFGCPLTGPTTAKECRPGDGFANAKAFRESRAAAAKLFDFKE